MKRPFSSSRALLPLVFLGVLACQDESPTISGIQSPSGARTVMAIEENEDTWNYYSADVLVTREAGTNPAQVSNGTTQSSFGIERNLYGNMWSSDVAEDPLQSTGFGSTIDPRMDVGRLQTDDAGSYLYAYTRGGTPISTQPSLMADQPPPPPPGHDPLPNFPTPPPGASANVVFGGGNTLSASKDLKASIASDLTVSAVSGNLRGHRADPRAWLANVVSTPKNRIKLAAGRIKHLGPPVGKVGNLDRYVKKIQGMDLEELVDPLTAATVERNLSVNGRLLVHLTRSFVDAGNGRFALARIRIENAQAGAPNTPQVTEINFSNVRIETRAN